MDQHTFRTFLFAGVALFMTSTLMAADGPVASGHGQFGVQSARTLALDQDSPKVKLGATSGTISAYDSVTQKISVMDAKGNMNEFAVESNTPITDHSLQVKSSDLHAGDRVTIHYDMEPKRINAIEKN